MKPDREMRRAFVETFTDNELKVFGMLMSAWKTRNWPEEFLKDLERSFHEYLNFLYKRCEEQPAIPTLDELLQALPENIYVQYILVGLRERFEQIGMTAEEEEETKRDFCKNFFKHCRRIKKKQSMQ